MGQLSVLNVGAARTPFHNPIGGSGAVDPRGLTATEVTDPRCATVPTSRSTRWHWAVTTTRVGRHGARRRAATVGLVDPVPVTTYTRRVLSTWDTR